MTSLAAAGAASAQSSVTLYGIADVGVQHLKGAASLTGLASGGMNGSRWGLKGKEDLGGGLRAKFELESGVNLDTGTFGQGGRAFGRTAIVGLEGPFGSITFGRQDTPISVLSDQSATLGSKPNDLQTAAGMLGPTEFSRSDNSIHYDSPKLFGALTLSAQFGFDYDGAEQPSRVGRQFGFNAIYKGGPLQAGAGHIQVRADNGATIKENQFNLGWDFGPAAVKSVFTRDDYGTAKTRDFLGGEVSVPYGNFRMSLGFGRLRNSTGMVNVQDDAKLWTAQAVYWLSKRTALYSFYTHVSNPGTGATPLSTVLAGTSAVRPGYLRSTSGAGEDSSQVRIGMRHAF